MNPPFGPAMMRALKVLADGEWHPLPVVLREAAKGVPPGQASRIYLSAGGKADALMDHGIAAGKRRVARSAISRAINRGLIELDDGPPGEINWRDLSRHVRASQRALDTFRSLSSKPGEEGDDP